MNRKALKQQAKLVMKTQYWRLLLIVFLYEIVTLDFVSLNVDTTTYTLTIDISGMPYAIELSAMIIAMLAILGLFSIFYSIFVSPVFHYGFVNHFKHQALGNPNYDLMAGFHENYKKIVKMNFIAGLEIALWTVVFVIPGIIKGLEYLYINEILEEHPDWTHREVMNESKRIMYGHKKEVFILDLSFFGWVFLATLVASFTFGFVSSFVTPYINLTNANAYLWFKSLDEKQYNFQNEPLV